MRAYRNHVSSERKFSAEINKFESFRSFVILFPMGCVARVNMPISSVKIKHSKFMFGLRCVDMFF